MTDTKFWGVDCIVSSNEMRPALGYIFAKSKPPVTAVARRAADKIAAAGADGVDADSVMLFDVQSLRTAGVSVTEDKGRLFLDAAPEPIQFLIPEKS